MRFKVSVVALVSLTVLHLLPFCVLILLQTLSVANVQDVSGMNHYMPRDYVGKFQMDTVRSHHFFLSLCAII